MKRVPLKRRSWCVGMFSAMAALFGVVIFYTDREWIVGVVMGLGLVVTFCAHRIEEIDGR